MNTMTQTDAELIDETLLAIGAKISRSGDWLASGGRNYAAGTLRDAAAECDNLAEILRLKAAEIEEASDGK